MTNTFVIEPLGGQDRSAFASGISTLDRYLREQASQDVRRLVASCFIAVELETKKIAGYYTLAAASVRAGDRPNEIVRRLPRYPLLPVALIGRLAVDQRFQGHGVGSTLLADAALRALKGDVKAFALIVEAKDANAVGFYRHNGFQPLTSGSEVLFLPRATLRKGTTGPIK